MPLMIDEMFLPATLTASPMSDEQFVEFCAQYPDYFIEMTADGEILITPPNYSLTGARNGKISAQLEMWASRDQRGIVTDASGGFVLPSSARRSPDAAWTLKRHILALDRTSLNGFLASLPRFRYRIAISEGSPSRPPREDAGMDR